MEENIIKELKPHGNSQLCSKCELHKWYFTRVITETNKTRTINFGEFMCRECGLTKIVEQIDEEYKY